MIGNSAIYNDQFRQLPPRFDNDELVSRYQAGEFLYHTERRDAERVIEIRERKKSNA